jgi:protein SCO1/2
MIMFQKRLVGLGLWSVMLVFIISIPFVPLILDKELNVPFLDQEGNENALVFFGFRGCSDVCPATLGILRQLFDSQKNTSQWPQVVFVDIDVHSDSTQASNFAKQFHPSFVGLHIPVEDLPEISAKFGLNIKQQDDQISHLGKIYLLRRIVNDWSLVKIYNPLSYSVETLQNELFNFNN